MGAKELDSIEFAFFMNAIRDQGGIPLNHLDRDAGVLNRTCRFWLVNGEPVIIENKSTINKLDGVDYKYLVHYPDDQEQLLTQRPSRQRQHGRVVVEPGRLPLRQEI